MWRLRRVARIWLLAVVANYRWFRCSPAVRRHIDAGIVILAYTQQLLKKQDNSKTASRGEAAFDILFSANACSMHRVTHAPFHKNHFAGNIRSQCTSA
jgi:hypothetical protein